jgi:uncharacterized membrane protein YeiH
MPGRAENTGNQRRHDGIGRSQADRLRSSKNWIFSIQMYPEFSTLLLPYLDLAGTAVFATSGALASARAHQTPLTFAFFAVVTGIGGSTLSELLMGVPVSWVHHPTNIAVCLVVALVTWTTPPAWWPNSAIDWFDAVGIAAYGSVGAAGALSHRDRR